MTSRDHDHNDTTAVERDTPSMNTESGDTPNQIVEQAEHDEPQVTESLSSEEPDPAHPNETGTRGFADGWQQKVITGINETMQRCVRHPYFAISMIILVSTVLNFILVFEWSYYQSYLTSDMEGYWERAIQIFDGDEKSLNTWVSNAPFYSRVIAAIFTWLEYLHLSEYRLETMLSLNILLSCFATLSLYLIGLKMLKHKGWSLALAATYAFAYPNLYFNTFLLGEPFAVPIIISALCLVMYLKDSYKIYLAGFVLAFGVGVRPSNGLLGLPCALYIFLHGFSFRETPWKEWIKMLFPRAVKAGLFSVAFFLIIFGIVAENNRISDGKLRGITAHSGYNFFLGQTQVHLIQSSWDGITYGFVPSSVAGNPEYGTIRTNIPIYDSERFYEEGKKILKANPHLWWDHLKKYNHLFFNNLFPAVPSVKGFSTLFDPFRHITFYMLVFCGLLFITFRERDTGKAEVLLFSSIFVLCAAALFFYTVTHQYFTNFSYTVYILAFVYLRSCYLHFNKYKAFIVSYVAVVLVSTVAYYTYKEYRYLLIDPKLKIVAEKNNGPIYSLEQNRNIIETKQFDVNNLEFLQSEILTHRTTGEYENWDINFFLTATTEFDVLQEGTYMLTFYADDGYRVKIDGETVLQEDRLKTMNEFTIQTHWVLEKGRHTMTVELFQNGVLSGLVGYYRRISREPGEAAPGPFEYRTRFGQGDFIGEDSEDIRFYYPGTAPEAVSLKPIRYEDSHVSSK